MRGVKRKAKFTLCYGILLLGLALLPGCGGSGGGTVADGGIGGSGLSSGEIEGFGSIIVNGVKFEVEGAEVETEHGVTTIISSATQTQHLAEGMQVEVEVEFNDDGKTGTATRILIDDELEGEVTGLATAPLTGVVTFSLLGQTVVAIPGNTHVDDTVLSGQLSSLDNGMFVEVHGLPDGNGNLQATFIEWKADSLVDFINLPGGEGEFEVTGAITATDIPNDQFNIGSLLIDYTGVSPDGVLAIGTLVEVKGDLNSGTLEAARVHVEDGLGNNLAKVEIEGLIRELNQGAETFSLKGQAVNYATARFFGVPTGGNPENELHNGLKVEAEGPVSGGVLVASKIKFKDSFRYEGAATKIDANTLEIALPSGGTLTVLVDASFTDDAGIDYTTRDAKIRARVVSGATLIASRIDDGGGQATRQIFQAPLVDFSESIETVELLDDGSGTQTGLIVFDTSGLLDLTQQGGSDSDFEIEDADVTRAGFYQALNRGDQVKARYDSGSEDQVEIELDD